MSWEGGAKQLNPPHAPSLPGKTCSHPRQGTTHLSAVEGTVTADPTAHRVLAHPLAPTSRRLPRLRLVGVICLSTQLDMFSLPRECSRMGGQWLACVGAGMAPKGLQQTPFHLFKSEIRTAQPEPCAALPLRLPACGPSTHLGTP